MANYRNLSRIPTIDLIRELERRKSMAGKFEARRDALERELADVEAELSAFEGTSTNSVDRRYVNRSAAARTRSANRQPLNAALQKLLKGRTMSVTEITEAVRKSGYGSNPANFTTIVNQTLLKRKALFKRLGRGLYTAKNLV